MEVVRNQLFDALQWGKWQAGHTRAECRQRIRHVLSDSTAYA